MKELQRDLEAFGTIRVAIVGSGLMGGSLLAQLEMLPGFEVPVVANRSIDRVLSAMREAEIPRERILVTDGAEEARQGLKEGKIIATTNNALAWEMDVHAVCDCTGNTTGGAEIAKEAIEHRRHMITFNVETDVLLGHYLRDLARKYEVVYTGIYGDEPGSIIELYEFCSFLGFEIIALGKGKNNALDFTATPESLEEEAKRKRLSPRMLTSFVDGTNTMIELNAVCNATGFVPDVPGCHGLTSSIEDLADFFLPEEQGGVMSRKRVVEFVKGIAPGVFAVVKPKSPVLDYEMRFLKMGKGPYYTIYRPYHLTSIEVPITIAKAVIRHETSIEPLDKPVAQTIAVAKRDLFPGDVTEGIGGHGVYGTLVTYEEATESDGVPIGLCNEHTKVLRPVKKGRRLTGKDILPDKNILTDLFYGSAKNMKE